MRRDIGVRLGSTSGAEEIKVKRACDWQVSKPWFRLLLHANNALVGFFFFALLTALQQHPFFAGVNWDDVLARRVAPPFLPAMVGRFSCVWFFFFFPFVCMVHGFRRLPGDSTKNASVAQT
jgi:hypothetical protein